MTWTWFLFVRAESTRPGHLISVPAAYGHVSARAPAAAIAEINKALDSDFVRGDFEAHGPGALACDFTGTGSGRAAELIDDLVERRGISPVEFSLTLYKGKYPGNGSPQVYR